MKKNPFSRLLGLCLTIVMMTGMIPTVFVAEFSDVVANALYHNAVDYVSDCGMMAGTSGSNFDPDGTMSRAMLVAVLYRLEGSPAVSGNGGFSDVTNGQYYTAAVAFAAIRFP